MNIVVFNFSDQKNIKKYLYLKYRVFVEEYGWPLKVDAKSRMLSIDRYDRNSTLFGMFDIDQLVGVCRCSFAEQEYPYANLLASYIEKSSNLDSQYAILTSYAFLKDYRGKPSYKENGEQLITYANELFLYVVDYLKSRGIYCILLSASVRGSEKAFIRWGFKAISLILNLKGTPVQVRNYAYEIR